MDQIPHEVIIIILSHLEYIDIFCLCTSKKIFYYLLYDDLFWKDKICQDFAKIAAKISSCGKKYNYKSYLNFLFDFKRHKNNPINLINVNNPDDDILKLKYFIHKGDLRLINHLSDKGIDFIEILEYDHITYDKTIITNIIREKILGDPCCILDDIIYQKKKSNCITSSSNTLRLLKVVIKYKLHPLINILTKKLLSSGILCLCHKNFTLLTLDQKLILHNFYFSWAASDIRTNDLIDFLDFIDNSFIEFIFYGSCFGGNLLLAKILLSKNDNIILNDRRYKTYQGLKTPYILSTAINYASSNNKYNVVNYLLSLNANPYDAINGAIESNHVYIIINILDLYSYGLTMYQYIVHESLRLNRPDIICSLIYKYNNSEYLRYMDKFKDNLTLKTLLNNMNGFISNDHLFVKLPLNDKD